MNHQCIYCRTTEQGLFAGREHVIPQAFGTFSSETPTLFCVCDNCNTYFAQSLDQTLARDTIEGVTRYKKGMVSRGNQIAKSLKFSLKGTEHGFFEGVILEGVDPKTGHLLPPVPQYWIRNKKDKKWEVYRLGELKDLNITDEKYGVAGTRESRVYAKSQADHDAVVEELKKIGIPYKVGEVFGPPPIAKVANEDGTASTMANTEGVIGRDVKRAIAKILLNFSAHMLGEEEVAKKEWDKVRDFVRYDKDQLEVRISSKPFWTGQETEEVRFADDSYNVRIENEGGNIVGTIQFYNLFTYEFILVEGYAIPLEKEVGIRFTPGKKPGIGFKAARPTSKEEMRRFLGLN